LITLECNDNKLTSLDISKNTALQGLVCNNLTSLDVSRNTALTYLDCSGSYDKIGQLTTLDVSKNTALTELYCSHNLFPNKAAIIGLDESRTKVEF